MPSRRDLIQMNEDEVAAFLDSQLRGVLGTTGRDGRPHMVTVAYLPQDNRIAITTFQKSQKLVNAERSGEASFLVELAHPYNEIRGVYASGPVTVERDAAAVAALSRAIRAKQSPEDERETPEMDYDRQAVKRAILYIQPDKILSWDHRKLGGVY